MAVAVAYTTARKSTSVYNTHKHTQLPSLESLSGLLLLADTGPLCARRLLPSLTRLTELALYRCVFALLLRDDKHCVCLQSPIRSS